MAYSQRTIEAGGSEVFLDVRGAIVLFRFLNSILSIVRFLSPWAMLGQPFYWSEQRSRVWAILI